MGGYGSGRRWSSKNTTSDYLRLDVRRLQQKECLEPGRSFGWQWTLNDKSYGDIRIRSELDRIVLSYRHHSRSEDWQSKEYPVLLTQTPCHFGGVRQWFLCPARGCGRRVAVLYGGEIFACRTCHQLTYESQREALHNRALSRAQGLHVRLGGTGAVADGLPPKPKGMHCTTYKKLARRFLRLEAAMDAAAAAYFGFGL
jgi:hypothetical protein